MARNLKTAFLVAKMRLLDKLSKNVRRRNPAPMINGISVKMACEAHTNRQSMKQLLGSADTCGSPRSSSLAQCFGFQTNIYNCILYIIIV